VSKQSTLNTFRINTCEKQGGGGPRFPRLQRPASGIQPPEPYAPRGASIPCGLSRLRILPVTTGVYYPLPPSLATRHSFIQSPGEAPLPQSRSRA
jgi:hypothetical protein